MGTGACQPRGGWSLLWPLEALYLLWASPTQKRRPVWLTLQGGLRGPSPGILPRLGPLGSPDDPSSPQLDRTSLPARAPPRSEPLPGHHLKPETLLIYLNFWLNWVFIAVFGLSLVAPIGGYSLVEVCRLLVAVTSLVAERRL